MSFRIAFISGMAGFPWGGSEELWAQSCLRLGSSGHVVAACVHGWASLPSALEEMQKTGIPVFQRPARSHSWAGRLVRRFSRKNNRSLVGEWLRDFSPDLVCISHGAIACGLEWMELCGEMKLPFTCIAQANAESFWPDDAAAVRLAAAYQKANAAFFVSNANLKLFERQTASQLTNAAVVRNPFKVDHQTELPWPDSDEVFKLACVARHEPPAKGQDLLIEVMAQEKWRRRNIQVNLFGKGPMTATLQKLVQLRNLQDQILFAGHVNDISQIWRQHHALILPSRHEGLPLSLVEAMLCGRTAIVTDVAGNTELLEDEVSGFVAAAATVNAVDEALERAWSSRERWREMGAAAQIRARTMIPSDPIAAFSDLLIQTANRAKTHSL